MAKEELLEFDGTVTEVLPDGNFRVKLDGLDASSYGCRVSDGERTVVRRKRGSLVGNWGLGFFTASAGLSF